MFPIDTSRSQRMSVRSPLGRSPDSTPWPRVPAPEEQRLPVGPTAPQNDLDSTDDLRSVGETLPVPVDMSNAMSGEHAVVRLLSIRAKLNSDAIMQSDPELRGLAQAGIDVISEHVRLLRLVSQGMASLVIGS